MRKSTVLVGVLGVLVGLGVLVLPATSFASTMVTTQTNTVTLGIDDILALTLVNGVGGTDVTYSNGTYTGTLDAGSVKASFGTSTFRVTCNYIGSGSNSCSTYGWKVQAASGNEGTVNGVKYATMEPADATANPAKIYSKAASLSASESNWMMSTTGVAKNIMINGDSYPTTAPAAQNSFGSLKNVPPKTTPATVISGNTFQTINSVANTFIGDQEFTATYGVSAGASTPADTYTGTITYTLSINASV